MKITAKQYARALFEEVDGKKASEAKEVVERFSALLSASNSLHMADRIESAFIEIWNKENSIVSVEITTARELHKDEKSFLNGFAKERTGAKEIVSEYNIDKKILGGAVVRYSDKVLDVSIKNRLIELKNKLNN